MTTVAEVQVQPAEQSRSRIYTDVAVIGQTGFDETAAKVLLERFVGTELGIHSFAGSLNMSDEDVDALEASAVFPIDLGRNQYKNRSCRSATEVVAKEFPSVQLTEGEIELVRLTVQDNESGVLNKWVDTMSIPWTLRKMYGIDKYGNAPKDVVARTGHVIHTWLRYMDGERDTTRDSHGLYTEPEFHHLFKKFDLVKPPQGAYQFNHFTALRYMRDMWMLGIPAEEIRERTEYWVEAWQGVQDAIAEGERQFAVLTPEKFFIGRLRGLVLESGDPFLNRAAACECDILVAKDLKTGHALIATHGLNIDRVVLELTRKEPGRWFEIRGWAVNGGLRNRGTEPTGLTIGELVQLLQKYPPILKK